jgi:enamine deaminase RidA (YjgF/YER057c/UK114 family)
MSAEKKLKALGLTLPPVSSPAANYVNAVQTGNLLYLAGKGPLSVDGKRPSGKLGRDFTIEQGYQHARTTGLDLIAVMKAELGSLDRVKRIVKVLGMVNCVPEFTDPPKVINGASDLFVEVFGERGRHARSAVGMNSLPMGIPVEIEMIVEVGPAKAGKAAVKKPAAARRAAKKAPGRKARR